VSVNANVKEWGDNGVSASAVEAGLGSDCSLCASSLLLAIIRRLIDFDRGIKSSSGLLGAAAGDGTTDKGCNLGLRAEPASYTGVSRRARREPIHGRDKLAGMADSGSGASCRLEEASADDRGVSAGRQRGELETGGIETWL
jgi:hypothetical protein